MCACAVVVSGGVIFDFFPGRPHFAVSSRFDETGWGYCQFAVGFPAVRYHRGPRLYVPIYNRKQCWLVAFIVRACHTKDVLRITVYASKDPLPLHTATLIIFSFTELRFVYFHYVSGPAYAVFRVLN